MITYLKERQYYEDLYDHGTIEQCREGERIVNSSFRKMEETLPAKELKERPIAWYVEYSKYYFYFVEFTAGSRYHKRDTVIAEWMERDVQQDKRLAEARLATVPFCHSCGGSLEVIDKFYLHREGHKEAGIVFLVACEPCHKRTTYWEDGTEREHTKTYCEKCRTEMTETHKETKKALLSTYNCPACGHSYKETLDFTTKSDTGEVDPYYELDRKRFCFDSDTMSKLENRIEHLGRLGKLYADATERTEHADIYDAVNDIKQLKIAELIEVLRLKLTKAHYTEFKLGEPQLGQEVIVEFTCLDAQPERKDYVSKNELRKLITKTLDDSNWRLMSDSIYYRLGYLRGRLRAYEGEEALKKLVEQRIKKGTLKPKQPDMPPTERFDFEKLDKVAAIKIYSEDERLVINSTPIDNGTKRPDQKITLFGRLHPGLRIIIPMRDNDDTVPAFIRQFDFKIEHSSISKKGSKARKPVNKKQAA